MKELTLIYFEIGQTIYLKADKDQLKQIITSINIRQGRVTYELSQSVSVSWHDDFEIAVTKDILLTTTE